jgi:hypothetical protein
MPEPSERSALNRMLLTWGVGIGCGVVVVVLFGAMVFERMQPRGAALRHSKTSAMVLLYVHTQSNFVDAPSSEIVRSSILPMYDQMKGEILAFEPLDDADTEWKAAMLEFLDVMIDGWGLMADAIDQGSMVVEDKALERFETATRILYSNGWEHPLPWPDQYDHVELVLFVAADQRIETEFNEHMVGNLTDAELADVLAAEVLPEWTAARDQFLLAAADSPAQYRQSMAQLVKYTELRTQAYTLQLQAIRESDTEKSTQALALIEQSRDMRDRIIAEKQGN